VPPRRALTHADADRAARRPALGAGAWARGRGSSPPVPASGPSQRNQRSLPAVPAVPALTGSRVAPILRVTMKARDAGRTGFFGYYFSYRLPGGPMP
jgi:hypothetical protein